MDFDGTEELAECSPHTGIFEEGNMTDSIARDWWAALSIGGGAHLRRCHRIADALLIPETLDLIRRLGWPGHRVEYAAILAIVLAHVREDNTRRIMRVCGRDRIDDETALLHRDRFHRLITTTEPEELLTGLVRLVRIMDGTVNIAELEQVLRWWNDKTRQRWAADYYAATAIETEAELSEGNANV